MEDTDLQRLLEGLRAKTIDVRLDVEARSSSTDLRVVVDRKDSIDRGERVAYVYRDREAADGLHTEEIGVTSDQAQQLIAAGARWVGTANRAP